MEQSTIFCYIIIGIAILFVGYAYMMFYIHITISKCLKETDVLAALEKTKLASLSVSYRKSLNILVNGVSKTSIPASEFFNDQAVAKAMSLNLRMLDNQYEKAHVELQKVVDLIVASYQSDNFNALISSIRTTPHSSSDCQKALTKIFELYTEIVRLPRRQYQTEHRALGYSIA